MLTAVKPGMRAISQALLLAVLCGSAARADDVLPRAAAEDRYAKMADRTPFAPPTPVVAEPARVAAQPGPKWSDQLTITGLTQQGGDYIATVLDKSQNQHFLLQSNREDAERHLAVASVQWGDLPEQTTVTLRHNNEFAPVHFDAGSGAASGSTVAGVPAVPRAANNVSTTRVPNIPPNPPGQAARSFNSPGTPQGAPNVTRRQMPIRTTPAINPPGQPPTQIRRPLSNADDDDP